MNIKELPIDWRQRLTDASFREAVFQFHVDSGGKAGGRRIASHEFPKRNIPYSEDMGRKMRKWTVQGYIIISPGNTDYIPRRDALVRALEADGPGWLKLPTFEPELVMCESYSAETRRRAATVVFNDVLRARQADRL
jgi:prophage DNA circulation protein